MDSSLLRKIDSIKNWQDSISHQLHKVSSDLQQLSDEQWWMKLLPMFGVILGAIISLWGQSIIKSRELDKAVAKEVRDSLNKIHSQRIILKYYLHELAYLQVDSKYQLYLSEILTDVDEKKKARDEHYNDYTYISEARNKISGAFAEINASIVSIYGCVEKEIPSEVSQGLQTFNQKLMTLKPQQPYDIKLTEPSQEQINGDMEKLSENYLEITNELEKLFNLLPALKKKWKW